MKVRTLVDKILVRIEISQYDIFLFFFFCSCIDFLNHLVKCCLSLFCTDQFPIKHRKRTALKDNHTNLDVRLVFFLRSFQLGDKSGNLIHNFANAVRGIQHEHHIAGQLFLCAGQRQGHAGRAVGVERRRGLGFGYLPILRLWLGRQRHDRHRADQHDQRQQTG